MATAKKKKKKAKPELRVVFDTSILFTLVASDLLKESVAKLILENSNHADLQLSWYLPQMVIDERRYQMTEKARELLPSIQKLERLLGHNLSITEDILDLRVNEAIERNLKELGLTTLDLDVQKTDWHEIIRRSVNREQPFQPGEKEKGFRDSIIAESFIQLVEQSPSTQSVCRLAIISNDSLLSDFIRERTKDASNVRVLSDLSELESLINTLVSEATEEFIAEISEKAESYFFDQDNDASLYYKEGIRKKIEEEFADELASVPSEATRRKGGTWWIGAPVFVKKKQQRTFWTNTIRVDGVAIKYESQPQLPGVLTTDTPTVYLPPTSLRSFIPPNPTTGVLPSSLTDNALGSIMTGGGADSRMVGGLRSIFSPPPKRVEVASGKTRFEVHWSINYTQTKKLTTPKIESIKCIGTTWGEE